MFCFSFSLCAIPVHLKSLSRSLRVARNPRVSQTVRSLFLKAVPLPNVSAVDFRILFAYGSPVDQQKQNGALLIAACIIAAIRLRGEPIQPSPKLRFVVSESVQLAKLVMRELLQN